MYVSRARPARTQIKTERQTIEKSQIGACIVPCRAPYGAKVSHFYETCRRLSLFRPPPLKPTKKPGLSHPLARSNARTPARQGVCVHTGTENSQNQCYTHHPLHPPGAPPACVHACMCMYTCGWVRARAIDLLSKTSCQRGRQPNLLHTYRWPHALPSFVVATTARHVRT